MYSVVGWYVGAPGTGVGREVGLGVGEGVGGAVGPVTFGPPLPATPEQSNIMY